VALLRNAAALVIASRGAAGESSRYGAPPRGPIRKEFQMATTDRKAARKVGKVMHELKRGELKSGSSGKKVTSRKQAIAIGLSEARRAGAKVPARKSARSK
jgi:uncharacterized protein DUF6496